MKQRRIRINLEDTEGAKFKFDIEGNVTKDKVLKLFELMDLMNIEEEHTPDLDSVGGKIWNVVENHFPAGKFTSSGVLEKYEDEYNEPIPWTHIDLKRHLKLSFLQRLVVLCLLKFLLFRLFHNREKQVLPRLVC